MPPHFFMKLNIELDEKELEELLELYNKVIVHIKRNKKRMESIYELNCDSCGADYEMSYIEHAASNQPMFCPFCGGEIDLTDVEDESLIIDDEFPDELDFDND